VGIVNTPLFTARKRAFVERLEREAAAGRVDADILPLLRRLNELGWAYTTSSCSGRILVAEAPTLVAFTKGRGFRQIAKWHHAVSTSDVINALSSVRGIAWLLVRGAIIHVAVSSPRRAAELLRIARDAGFKHSGILSVRRDGIIVEINSDDRLDIPLSLIPRDHIGQAVKLANAVLLGAKLRLALFSAYVEEAYFGARGLVDAARAAIREYVGSLFEQSAAHGD